MVSNTLLTDQRLKDYALLGIGLLFSLFANGRYVIPLATWLAPIFLLQFIRSNPSKLRVGLVVILLIPTTMFNWQGVVPGSLWMLFQISLLITLVLSSAYTIDWFLQRTTIIQDMTGLLKTLIFPLAYTSSEFLLAQVNPYGTFSVLAYTQWGIQPILQLVSLTGLWGISFLIYWTAAIVNQVWEAGFDLNIPKIELRVFTGIFILILLFGSIQSGNVSMANAIGNESVRVASIPDPSPAFHVMCRKLVPVLQAMEWIPDVFRASAVPSARHAGIFETPDSHSGVSGSASP